jgi:hypothetical protein
MFQGRSAHVYRTALITQVMDFMLLQTFQRCVDQFQDNFCVKNFNYLDQFHIMVFTQLGLYATNPSY